MELKTLFNIRNINMWTILSILALVAGIIFYVLWGITYSVWYDIGIYSVTIVFVLGGIIGILLSLTKKKEAS